MLCIVNKTTCSLVTCHGNPSYRVNQLGEYQVENGRVEHGGLLDHEQAPCHEEHHVENGQSDEQLVEKALFVHCDYGHKGQQVP